VFGLALDVSAAPTAAYIRNPASGNAPLAVTFTGTYSSTTTGTITNYQWDFGDGTTGNGPIVTHTYPNVGRFTSTLTVTDSTSATASTSLVTVVMNARPAALIGESISGAPGSTVSYSVDYTISPDIGGSTMQWDLVTPPDVSIVSVVEGAAATAAQKQLTTGLNLTRVLIFGFNQTTVGNGRLATYTLQISPSATPGTYPLTFTAPGVSGTLGQDVVSIPLLVTNGQIQVTGTLPDTVPPGNPTNLR